jgi:hypothetical protein
MVHALVEGSNYQRAAGGQTLARVPSSWDATSQGGRDTGANAFFLKRGEACFTARRRLTRRQVPGSGQIPHFVWDSLGQALG